jgi:hypothetical protein
MYLKPVLTPSGMYSKFFCSFNRQKTKSTLTLKHYLFWIMLFKPPVSLCMLVLLVAAAILLAVKASTYTKTVHLLLPLAFVKVDFKLLYFKNLPLLDIYGSTSTWFWRHNDIQHNDDQQELNHVYCLFAECRYSDCH